MLIRHKARYFVYLGNNVNSQSCTTEDCPQFSIILYISRNLQIRAVVFAEKGFTVGIRIRIRNPEPIYMSSILISTVLFRIRNFKTRNKQATDHWIIPQEHCNLIRLENWVSGLNQLSAKEPYINKCIASSNLAFSAHWI